MLDKNSILRYTIEDIKIHPWIAHMFKDEGIDRKFYGEIASDSEDFYDDTNPENKFNNSKKLFKDQTFMTKITMNNKTNLNGQIRNKPAVQEKLGAINLPKIREVRVYSYCIGYQK